MIVYRLINEKYDTTSPGEFLCRTSDHSNQKLGDGIYFALDHNSAIQFAGTHNHKYTHLLKCEIEGCSPADFADLVSEPSLITRWKVGKFSGLREAVPAYCNENGLRGLVWEARAGWTELLLLKQFAVGTVRVIEAEKLSYPDESGPTNPST